MDCCLVVESRVRRALAERNGEFTHRDVLAEGCMRGRESMKEIRRIYEWVSGRHEAVNNRKLPVAMRLGDTPVLIPNTMVKT